MFLGYAENSKAYKLWDGALCKVVVSRDVTFDESCDGNYGDVSESSDSNIDTNDVITLSMSMPETTETTESSTSEPLNSPTVDELQNTSNEDEDEEEVSDDETEDKNTSGTETSQQEVTSQLRRSSRVRKPPGPWWKAMVTTELLIPTNGATEVPSSYKQAMNGPRASFWQKGIDKELASQKKNKTWTLVPRSEASNILTSRWVFAVKQLPNESGKLVEAAIGRLVARGFQQVAGLDYSETYAPVIKFTTIRLLLALVAHFDLELHQMDVVTAFLNGDLDEDIYMEQPEGCVDKSKPDHVCKLLKAIYGLKQAHRMWHRKIDDFLLVELGFKTSRSDPCLYIKREGDVIMIIALYVDDLLLAGTGLNAILWMKGELSK